MTVPPRHSQTADSLLRRGGFHIRPPVPVRLGKRYETPPVPVGRGLAPAAALWVGVVFLFRGGGPPGVARWDSAACPSLRGPILSVRAERIGRKARQREGLCTKPPFPLESHPPKLGGRVRLADYRARSRPPAVPRNRTRSGMTLCVFDGAPVGNGLDRSANRTGVTAGGSRPAPTGACSMARLQGTPRIPKKSPLLFRCVCVPLCDWNARVTRAFTHTVGVGVVVVVGVGVGVVVGVGVGIVRMRPHTCPGAAQRKIPMFSSRKIRTKRAPPPKERRSSAISHNTIIPQKPYPVLYLFVTFCIQFAPP